MLNVRHLCFNIFNISVKKEYILLTINTCKNQKKVVTLQKIKGGNSYLLHLSYRVIMEKNLLFDVMNALQIGGYSDEVVLYNFEDTDVQTEFGDGWRKTYNGDSRLNGRMIAVYCKNCLEMLQMFDFVEKEARFDRYADDFKYELLSLRSAADVIVLLYC